MSSMIRVAERLEKGVLVGIFADDGRKFKSLYLQQGVFTEHEYVKALENSKSLSGIEIVSPR